MISWKNADVKIRTTTIVGGVNIYLNKGKSIGIIGENGSGKTTLAKAFAGLIPVAENPSNYNTFEKPIFVSFQSSIKVNTGFAAFRQQRWNNIDPDAVPTVANELNYNKNNYLYDKLLEKFDLKKHLNSYVISLSNGEQRKLELIKALAKHPDLLVLDNAYNGLDIKSRMLLTEMLDQLVADQHSIIITGLKLDDFPKSISNFIHLTRESTAQLVHRNNLININTELVFNEIQLPEWKNSNYNELFSFDNTNMKIGHRTILNNINWQVKPGERWVLSGENGSGKTSLLNLIFADNPKAYTCSLKLFGKIRGSGESIWDIKRQIGFISPELQQYLPQNQDAIKVICSGLFESEGLYIKPTSYQVALAKKWLKMIGKLSWTNKLFGELSASEQKIVLIIRTLIKNPPLLLLDEPFQGLDSHNIAKIQQVLNLIANSTNCAMVFVTHYRTEIPTSFTYEIKLKNGEIEYLGIFQR